MARKKPGKSGVPAASSKKSSRVALPGTADAGKKANSRAERARKDLSPNNAPQQMKPAEAGSESRQPGFPVVGIGASAGGLEALEELLDHMPAQTGMAFVVVTHQHPGHTSLLPELLGRSTKLKVVEARDGLNIEPNHVYVGPPGGHLAIYDGTLHRMETSKGEAPKLPIDYFFRSLAEDQHERAICIVLSGTGTDGTLGLKAIKGESGMVMVEEPQSAKYSGMPASAIATGLADYVLPPAAMPERLLAYAKGPYLCEGARAIEEQVVPSEPLQKVLVLLRSRTGNDFSAYKITTLRRRIERRMNVHQIKNYSQYLRYLQTNPHELDILFKELLIGVTNFFRDPEAWESLSSGALPQLLESRPENYILRAWVPGCSSGEEAFSLAIAMRECIEKIRKQSEVQIFATDVDADAIETARAGQYPDSIAVDVSPARLERCFIHQDNLCRIRKDIREMTVFAVQNVIKDPPFTKLDFISCRNLLIYLNADTQRRLLSIFHYALKPGGILFLGTSETIGSLTDLFEPLDKRWKIFRRKETLSALHRLPEFPTEARGGELADDARFAGAPAVKAAHVPTVIERLLVNRFAPASVVVNDRGNIIYIHGRTGAFLEPAQGQPRNNLLEMAREGLQRDLASALRQSATQKKDIVRGNVRVKTNGEHSLVTFSVENINEPEAVRGLLLVTFKESTPAGPLAARRGKIARKKTEESGRIADLERELQYTKESLQTTVEELETTNEELKSTNEELQSTNEELQSSNEELETSKEEMQSLNEELTTVNAELQSKVDDLSQTNDDMQNLLNSTDIATVFLDNDLNIKRFTEKTPSLVTLRPSDVGRPISELASNLETDDLIVLCRMVLKTLVPKENEVRTKNGSYFLTRIMPYRTAENVIDGLVITFVDINRVKQAERAGAEATAYYRSIIDTLQEPLAVLDEETHVVFANRAFNELFGTTTENMDGKLLYKLGNGIWDVPELRTRLENVLPHNAPLEKYEVSGDFPVIGHRTFQLDARGLPRDGGLPRMILLAVQDVTER
ncbi:MAG: chemotaxis protein CheB [Alphaproteobacteria bacterium]